MDHNCLEGMYTFTNIKHYHCKYTPFLINAVSVISIEGTVPSEWGNISSLTYLAFHVNQLEGM